MLSLIMLGMPRKLPRACGEVIKCEKNLKLVNYVFRRKDKNTETAKR